MKKFIIALSVLVLLFMALDAAHYRLGWYIDPVSYTHLDVYKRQAYCPVCE